MAKILRVQLSVPPTPTLMHRFGNFGEDVWKAMKEDCAISLDEIDTLTGTFHLRELHKRFVRTAAATVREIAEKHHMSESVHVDEITDATDS